MLKCSFCGKDQDKVRYLIASGLCEPDVYICEECVVLCVQIYIGQDTGRRRGRRRGLLFRRFGKR